LNFLHEIEIDALNLNQIKDQVSLSECREQIFVSNVF